MKNILLIDDELSLSSLIKKGLIEEGYTVIHTFEGMSSFDILLKKIVDLVILDIVLPGMNGFEICKRIRELGYKDLPILMLTVLGSPENTIKGLQEGADDYLVKPFKFKELLARIRTLLRRKNINDDIQRSLKIADLELDLISKITTRGSKAINLTFTEYRLLEFFMKNQGKILSRKDILENVWDTNINFTTNLVDVYINYLRNKIDKGYKIKLIHSVKGMGYIMKTYEC